MLQVARGVLPKESDHPPPDPGHWAKCVRLHLSPADRKHRLPSSHRP